MDADIAVRNFQLALVAGYATWRRVADATVIRERVELADAFGDWAQALWELLVERPGLDTGEYLDLYRSGSDYEQERYSRVFFHDALPTHEVFVQTRDESSVVDILSGQEISLSSTKFDGFVARTGQWYDEAPPFDHVLLVDGKEHTQRLVAAEHVCFSIRRIPQSHDPTPPGDE